MRAFSCVAHDTVFSLIEKKSEALYSTYDLWRNASRLGGCEFPSHLSPQFSVSTDGSVAIYGCCNAYLIEKNQGVTSFEAEEEIGCIWFLDDIIIVKYETIVASRDRSGFAIKNEYQHSEIILHAILHSPRVLVFQDLDNGVFQLNIDDFSVSQSDYPFAPLA